MHDRSGAVLLAALGRLAREQRLVKRLGCFHGRRQQASSKSFVPFDAAVSFSRMASTAVAKEAKARRREQFEQDAGLRAAAVDSLQQAVAQVGCHCGLFAKLHRGASTARCLHRPA